jgi:hypothetical protein
MRLMAIRSGWRTSALPMAMPGEAAIPANSFGPAPLTLALPS